MTKYFKLIRYATIATLCTLSVAANATNFEVTNPLGGVHGSPFIGNYTNGNVIVSGSDSYFLTVSGNSLLTSALENVTAFADSGYSFNSLSYSIAGPAGFTSVLNLLGDSSSKSTTLIAGDYTITVNGNSNSKNGGVYSLGLNVRTAPVAEPESYALMLAGLSLVGFVARRRKVA